MTKTQLVQDLKDLGLASGDLLFFQGPFESGGPADKVPRVFIEAFLELIGPEGTLVAATTIPARKGIRPYFNVKSSPSEAGILTETLRTWPGVLRSKHPTHSVAARGPLAEEIVSNQGSVRGPLTPWGRDAVGFGTPWERLYDRNARVLLIGESFEGCGFAHHAQMRYVSEREGITQTVPWPDFDLSRLAEIMRRDGAMNAVRVGEMDCLLTGARDIVDRVVMLLAENPAELAVVKPVEQWRSVCEKIERLGRPRASTFKVSITPPGIENVARPLHMRGVIFDHPQNGKAAHLVWDHGAFLPIDGDPIRRAVAEASGVPFEAVLLTATHTHSDYWWPFVPHPEFVPFVAEQAAGAAKRAASELEPFRAGWTTIQAPGIRRSRTVYLKDGRAYTERWAIPSSWHVPEADILRHGPDDNELRLLVLERLDGSRLAVMANFSCHNSAGLKAKCIQDDFFGVAMEIVEAAEGGGCTVLVSPGSEGDQDPTAIITLGGNRDLDYVKKLGKRLAGYILVGTADVGMHDLFAMGTASQTVTLPVREDWKPFARKSGFSIMEEWAERGEASAEVSALAVGDYAMVGIPAEFFTTPARSIREHAPFEITSVMSLTNGDMIYVAEKEAFFEGSLIYGTQTAMPAVVEKGSSEILSRAGLSVLRSLKAGQISSLKSSSG
jgi:aminoglycoside N3'-acetyltransferase